MEECMCLRSGWLDSLMSMPSVRSNESMTREDIPGAVGGGMR